MLISPGFSRDFDREEYVQALEHRLSRIESLVQASGILEEQPQQQPPQAEVSSGNDAERDVDIHAVMADAEISGPSGPRRERMNSGDLSPQLLSLSSP